MHSLFRTQAILFILVLAQLSAIASPKPVSPIRANLPVLVKNLDARFDLRENSGKKICSCQILNLASSNYDHRNIAVLAEKTFYGNVSSDQARAKAAVEKEKKQIRTLFYNHIEVVESITANSDCSSLFRKLKAAHQGLTVYSVINADIVK